MAKYEITATEPENIEELKKLANDKTSWRNRLRAVETLKHYDCQKSRDIVTRLAINDLVFTVKEAAFRAAQGFGVTSKGKPIYLGRKPKGHLIKDINKKLEKVRNSFSGEFTLDEFKVKFRAMYPEAYDVYDGDRGNKMDEWISNVLKSLPKKV